MKTRRTIPILAAILVLSALPAMAQIHCSELEPLTREAPFPRCTRAELIVAGFPDHLHAHSWRDWEVPRDEAGDTYGPGSLCQGKVLSDPAGRLLAETGEMRLGRFVLMHNPAYDTCDVAPWLELVEWANRRVYELMGFASDDTLFMMNPDNAQHYKEMTGMGVWRFFRREGDRVVIQPFPVLRARTLEAHAAMMVVTDWLLEKNLPVTLPPWMHYGLLEYMAEGGVHLANYMNEFREQGNVLLSAPLIDALLGGEIDADEGRDRENFRRASYSAFLMMWELIENQGGLDAWNEFVDLVVSGNDLDQAATRVYGLDMAELAGMLDPAQLGEPDGRPMGTHKPHVQP